VGNLSGTVASLVKFSPEVNKQIGIDVTEFKGGRYKQFDDLLDGILCAYLAYYFWYWETRGVGCWAILKQGV